MAYISGGLLPSHAFASRYYIASTLILREWIHQWIQQPGRGGVDRGSGCRDTGWRHGTKAVAEPEASLESTNRPLAKVGPGKCICDPMYSARTYIFYPDGTFATGLATIGCECRGDIGGQFYLSHIGGCIPGRVIRLITLLFSGLRRELLVHVREERATYPGRRTIDGERTCTWYWKLVFYF
jgi:hypothetical protein